MVAIADVLGLMQSGSVDDVDSTKNRVLVCAPSHAAADVITHRLQAFLNQAFIFRLYDQSRPTNTVPATIMPHTCRNPITNEFTLPASTGKKLNDLIYSVTLFMHACLISPSSKFINSVGKV